MKLMNRVRKIRVDQIKQFFPSQKVEGGGAGGGGGLRTPTLILPRSLLPVFLMHLNLRRC